MLSIFDDLLNLAKRIKDAIAHSDANLQEAKNYTDDKFQTVIGNGMPTNAVASTERCIYIQVGNIVMVTGTFTTASSGMSYTTEFFTGFPKPKSGYNLRFVAQRQNANTPFRLEMSSNGTLRNAYTVGTIASQEIEFYISYIADSFVGGVVSRLLQAHLKRRWAA